MQNDTSIWGIDLGGTKIEGAILANRHSTKTLARLRVDTEAQYGYEHILGQISKLIEQLKAESGRAPRALGFGTPGSIDPPTQLLKNSNTVCLNGKPILQDLEARFGIPIYLANDANCFAVAETHLGIVPEKVVDAQVVFGVIMGTGVGGGLVVHGKVLNGKNGIGGEWGHNFLDESGGDCYCGKVGCVEKVIAGPALEKYYAQLSGQKRSMKAIMRRYYDGTDEAAIKTIQRLLRKFGEAISVVINIVDPDAIVLGGGLGNIDLLYTEGVEICKEFVFNPRLDTPFLRPKLGDSAGVFGAALLVPE
ncbi:MAG: ROK family protein [Bacteroidota bacterium]